MQADVELSHERLIKLKIEWSVAGLDQQIEDLKAELKRIEQSKLTLQKPTAIESTVKSQRSSEFDVSNELENLQKYREKIIQKLEKRYS